MILGHAMPIPDTFTSWYPDHTGGLILAGPTIMYWIPAPLIATILTVLIIALLGYGQWRESRA